MNKIIITALVLLLSGCATEKQDMPFANYEGFALNEAIINKCVAQGDMDYNTAATGKNIVAQRLNSWRYDPVIYQNVLNGQIAKFSGGVSKEDCNTKGMDIAQSAQQIQQAYEQERIQQANISQLNQTLQNMQPKTTYCNRIGTQVLCNTY